MTVNSNTISGVVFDDANDDGIEQAGESGLTGVTVLLTGRDNLGDAVSLTTTTAGTTGAYSFTGLRPGSYAVSITPPSGYLNGKETVGSPFGGSNASADLISGIAIPLGTNAPGAGYDFAELLPASIAGLVFSDLNDNGAADPGEPGLDGVTITLTGTNDLGVAVNATTTSVGTGAFDFADLRPGTYTITETAPAGYLPGTDGPGDSGGTFSNGALSGIVLGQGGSASGITFAELAPATIAGSVYLDANDDGAMESGEPGVAGVVVTLTGTNDLGVAVDTSVLTAADGSYAFSDLRPGTYAVSAATPAGDLAGRASVGTLGGASTALDAVSGVATAAGASGTGYDLALLQPGSLAGSVSLGGDQGCNCGAPDVAVTLTGTDDLGHSVILTTTTAADGSYTFNGLRPGTYSIGAATPAGDIMGMATPGTPGGTAGIGQIDAIAMAEGVCGTREDFTVYAPASLSGLVYDDLGGVGTRQPGDPGLSGATVTLTGTDDAGDAVDLTTTTAADGSYAFDGLTPGTYTLTETPPSGYLQGQDVAGSAGGVAGVGAISDICLGGGAAGDGYTFANLAPSSVAGTVVSPDGKTGMAGATVTLMGVDAMGRTVTRQDQTGDNGSYAFDGLLPGTYDVSVTVPQNDLSVQETPGTQGGVAGSYQIDAITLRPGVAAANYQFAAAAAATVSGTIYLDANDGARQAGEAGIPGVPVILTGTTVAGQPVSEAVATSADGAFNFDGLASGTYTVAVASTSGDLVGKGSSLSRTFTLASGQSATSAVGLIPSSIVSGMVYLDAGRTGTHRATDFGIAGVPIVLTGTNDLGQTVTEKTTTAADGAYQFVGLRPGTYSVERGDSPAFGDGRADVGTLGGQASGLTIAQIHVGAGGQGLQYDFGQLIKPHCVLTTTAYRRVLATGPHPTGPIATGHHGGASLPRRVPSRIARWLPSLAQQITQDANDARGHARRASERPGGRGRAR